jgi:hypothetical protein
LHLTKIREGRKNGDIAFHPGGTGLNALKQDCILLETAVHLPVSCDELFTHGLNVSDGEKLADYSDRDLPWSIIAHSS